MGWERSESYVVVEKQVNRLAADDQFKSGCKDRSQLRESAGAGGGSLGLPLRRCMSCSPPVFTATSATAFDLRISSAFSLVCLL